jgi:hypothetical protein
VFVSADVLSSFGRCIAQSSHFLFGRSCNVGNGFLCVFQFVWWESRSVGARTGGATKDTYQSVARYVKENPIPALLVGAGVAWMIIEATTSDDEETRFYTETASHKGKRSDSATRYPSEYQGDDQTVTGGKSGSGIVAFRQCLA